MSQYFANAKTTEVAEQYAALRNALSGLRGVTIVPNETARQAALAALPQPPGKELFEAITLLADLDASGAFADLIKDVGRPTKGPPLYQFQPSNLTEVNPDIPAVSLINTYDAELYFCIAHKDITADVCGMVAYESLSGTPENIERDCSSDHVTLRSFLAKLLLIGDSGNSLLFGTTLSAADNLPDSVSRFHNVATALYGPPAKLGELDPPSGDLANGIWLYEGDNVILFVEPDQSPDVTLWVPDRSQPWNLNADLLSVLTLDEESIHRWSTEKRH